MKKFVILYVFMNIVDNILILDYVYMFSVGSNRVNVLLMFNNFEV